MEPNVGGVTHMTVINPGRPQKNPFQWITGSATGRNKRVSPQYRTMNGAREWAKKNTNESATLVSVDEYGTIMNRPMSRKQVLTQNRRRSSMAYDLERLKKAMRANGRAADARLAWEDERERLQATERARHSKPQTKESQVSTKKSSKKRASKKTSKKAGAKAVVAAAKSASKQAAVAKRSATKAKKTTSKAVATKAAKVAVGAAKKASKAAAKATSKAAAPGAKPAAKKAATRARKAASKAVTAAVGATKAARRVSTRPGRLSRRTGSHRLGSAPSPVYRLFNKPYSHITGFERVKSGSKRSARRVSKKSSKKRASKKTSRKMTANLLARTGQRNGSPSGKHVQVVQFGPHSKRKGYAVYVPGHVSERAYVRKFHFGGAARAAHSRAMRDGYRKHSKKAPLAANGRSSMRRNSKRRSKRVSKNRRSRRSRRLRGNRYVVANRRHSKRHSRRGLRRNVTIFGVDPISQVAIPGVYAVSGLMATNAVSNFAANMPAIRNILDSGRSADDAFWTKTLAGAAAAAGMVAFGGKMPSMIRQNLTPLIAGMGCAVAVRVFRGNTSFAPLAPYLGTWGAGFGEYVNQPLGAYVTDPSMGEYVNQPLGEYVNQPLGSTMYAAAGMGDSVDGLMDVMEASAGVGAYEAAAGTMYAAAGMGADEVAMLTPPRDQDGYQQPPFVSTETPIDIARDVTAVMRRDQPVRPSLVTHEAREGAGGLFSRSIFGPMLG